MGVIRIAHAMWMKGNALLFIHKMKKKNETLLLMFLNMLQMWEFGFLFLNVDELVIYSTVFLFHMKLFSVTIVFIDYFISPHGGKFCWILIK